ncbi:MAG TPA: 2,3-bisphosphoglycerate-independent phosphoglycerate mutase [Anaerolineae bacterium]|nr:2,3-bisphosphoglycerate-independent phosphoglycerate mutase [Anaerolineae bacterium]
MVDQRIVSSLVVPNTTKIVLMVVDGLGGLPLEPGGLTELETAQTPNLDTLAREGICGLHDPVGRGITPGSGPAHLALFGYDPIEHQIGRGVLEALGIGFQLQAHDFAARGNFCTVDDHGLITDRRAGRIPTEKGAELVQLLRSIQLPGVDVFVEPVKEYRFVVVLRGPDLHGPLSETDPQRLGATPLAVEPLRPEAERAASLFNQWIAQARNLLADHRPANMVTLRGLDKNPGLPTMQEVYGLRAAAIAAYPMYRGVARLVGMDVLPTGESMEEEAETLKAHWEGYDFFFFHLKKTDSSGEDGDFEGKVSVIEQVDKVVIPALVSLQPDVLVITGDHSTPALLRSHSWHPVPVLVHSRHCRSDGAMAFSESECAKGGLGRLPATDIMPLAMANALRLTKFGA